MSFCFDKIENDKCLRHNVSIVCFVVFLFGDLWVVCVCVRVSKTFKQEEEEDNRTVKS